MPIDLRMLRIAQNQRRIALDRPLTSHSSLVAYLASAVADNDTLVDTLTQVATELHTQGLLDDPDSDLGALLLPFIDAQA